MLKKSCLPVYLFVCLPYNGFISRGANFLEFPKLNIDSGKFMLTSFYYYSLASPDHLRESAYQLNIISATISSLIREALLCYWSLLVLHQQSARGWVLYNTSRSSGNGIMSCMGNSTNYNRSIKLRGMLIV